MSTIISQLNIYLSLHWPIFFLADILAFTAPVFRHIPWNYIRTRDLCIPSKWFEMTNIYNKLSPLLLMSDFFTHIQRIESHIPDALHVNTKY